MKEEFFKSYTFPLILTIISIVYATFQPIITNKVKNFLSKRTHLQKISDIISYVLPFLTIIYLTIFYNGSSKFYTFILCVCFSIVLYRILLDLILKISNKIVDTLGSVAELQSLNFQLMSKTDKSTKDITKIVKTYKAVIERILKIMEDFEMKEKKKIE